MSSVYTVGQVNAYIKMMFSQDFLLNRIYVKGEVSNCKYHPSGHIYFSLKDETGSIACILFANARKDLAFRLENGQQIVAFGSVNIYERDGTYQIYVKQVRLDGLGVLYERFAALKRELEEMGMFAEEYKQPVPDIVSRLGLVTASSGAAVRDMIQIAKRRHPGIQIILCPVKVQGEGAAESIAAGIAAMDRIGVDTIIVGRGGGSMEDLWAFNEEIVARAIFECRTPIISAVGHETDTTIADYVADLRAPTPSAGAELAVVDIRQIWSIFEEARLRLQNGMEQQIRERRGQLALYRARLRVFSPQQQAAWQRQELAQREDALRQAMQERIREYRMQLLLDIERMKGLSPLAKLEQGMAFVTDGQGRRITRASETDKGRQIRVYLADGRVDARVEDVRMPGHS